MPINPVTGENPRPAVKDEFPRLYNDLLRRVKSLERIVTAIQTLPEVAVSGKSNAEIDRLVFGFSESSEYANGKLISDPSSNSLYIRQSGIWKKIE